MIDNKIEPKECKYCVNHRCVHPYFKNVSCESWSLCDLFTPKIKKREMNTPIIDPSTLTEEQREKIKDFYTKIENDSCHVDEYNDWVVGEMLDGLETLFCEEFFEKGEMI